MEDRLAGVSDWKMSMSSSTWVGSRQQGTLVCTCSVLLVL